MRKLQGMLWFILIAHLSFAYARLKDPTQPFGAVNVMSASDAFVLHSVRIGPQHAVALLNGEFVTVGSQLAGATVIAIEPTQVVIRRDQTTQIIPLIDFSGVRSAR